METETWKLFVLPVILWICGGWLALSAIMRGITIEKKCTVPITAKFKRAEKKHNEGNSGYSERRETTCYYEFYHNGRKYEIAPVVGDPSIKELLIFINPQHPEEFRTGSENIVRHTLAGVFWGMVMITGGIYIAHILGVLDFISRRIWG